MVSTLASLSPTVCLPAASPAPPHTLTLPDSVPALAKGTVGSGLTPLPSLACPPTLPFLARIPALV